MEEAPAKTRVVWQWLSSSTSFKPNQQKQLSRVLPVKLDSSLLNTSSPFPSPIPPTKKVRMNLRWSITPCSPRVHLHRNPGSNRLSTPLTPHFRNNNNNSNLRYQKNDFRRDRLVTSCIVDSLDDEERGRGLVHSSFDEEQAELRSSDLTESSIWHQMKEIVVFAGPATGLWICGPLMSLIDTAVIGQGSSVELAALGPGTVFCDYTSYIFMFLSIATSNLVATSLATQDKNQVQHRISVLLFVGLICGFIMFFFTRFFSSSALAAFTGPKNVHLLPAANTYVQIRGLAWPSVLIGWVAQSASLGMKDSWGPLKALVVASVVNGVGDVVLCRVMSYGIAGAAWATMASQVIASYMMLADLNNKGYNAFSVSIPTLDELMRIVGLAAPVFIVMMSKVAFFTLLVYFATSMGTVTAAAHQVMLQSFYMCTVWGEPLSQTAQSFMPELLYGVNRSQDRARMLLKSLVVIGVIVGIVLGCVATIIPRCFPYIFTPDPHVIREMHKVLIPFFLALSVTPPTLSLEGTLLAGQDLKFISTSMSGCFTLGALLLQRVSGNGFGLTGCWYTLAGFQWARFLLALWRLTSPNSILYAEDPSQLKVEKLKAA